jgi:hypothetical protein
VGNLISNLRTDLADPIERTRAIHRVMREVKARNDALGADILESWVEFTPPRPYAFFSRCWSWLGIGARVRPPINVIISNVRGPGEPLAFQGARLIELHSVGPILEGVGLNITAWSYGDDMDFSLIAAPEALPDPWALIDCLVSAHNELLAAAVGPDEDREAAPCEFAVSS